MVFKKKTIVLIKQQFIFNRKIIMKAFASEKIETLSSQIGTYVCTVNERWEKLL